MRTQGTAVRQLMRFFTINENMAQGAFILIPVIVQSKVNSSNCKLLSDM